MRTPREIAKDKLPDLVTFADVNDPGTIMEVDPNDLQATLRPGVSWNEISLEITNDPVTKGIELKLPWIDAYADKMLDGAHFSHTNTLANRLSTANFRER